MRSGKQWEPTSNPAQAYQIISDYGISVIRVDDNYEIDSEGFCTDVRIPVWCASKNQNGVTTSTEHQSHESMFQICESEVVYGSTPLIAAMRRFVASNQEVDVPDELC